MSLPTSDIIEALLQNTVKKPQLIFEVEGLPTFSSIPSYKYAEFGDPGLTYGLAGLVYGGLAADPTVLPYIDIGRSTNQITQQLLIDKGGFSSITNFTIHLVDKNQYITQLITPGNTVADILGRKAKVYMSLEGAGHPQDSILFFSGIITDIYANAGNVEINLSSPERLKNLEIFPKVSTVTTANLLIGDTTVLVEDTNDFLLPADGDTFKTYIRIEDELIEYTGKTPTSLTGLVRGQLGTVANAHNTSSNVESFYRLQGNLRDLALKLMLSGADQYYLEDEPILAFNVYGVNNVTNAIFLNRYNIDQVIGIVIGDTVNISDAFNAGNNGVATVTDVVNIDVGSYLILNKTLITEGSGATVSIASKYNVLPKFASLEMTPDQVDIAEFERVYTQFSTQFFSYDFYIKDQVNGSEFINTQILYPSGAYALPRKAKTSLGLTIPPLAQSKTKTLSNLNITNASRLSIKRSVGKNFYNAITYKYDLKADEDRYLRGKITQSASSTNRIKIANKALQIVSDGIRESGDFEFLFNTQSKRFLDRYQFAAESVDVEVLFGEAFTIEIGDTVILDGRNLQLSDTKDGNATRNFLPRLFEVQNKVMSTNGKAINLTLVDTAYNLDGRYGVFSPSSIVDVGSTTTNIKLKKSYGDTLTDRNSSIKWKAYYGETVLFRSDDWSYQETTKLVSADPSDPNAVIVFPALSGAPASGLIMDTPRYPTNTDKEDQAIYKAVHCSFNKQLEVVAGISQTQFTIDPGDVGYVQVGFIIYIHNDDYSSSSVERLVTDVTGTTVTVEDDLGFIPSLDQKIELLGYNDGGKPYRWL